MPALSRPGPPRSAAARQPGERRDRQVEIHPIAVAALTGARIDFERPVSHDEPVRVARRRSRDVRNRPAPWIAELELAVGARSQRVAGLVHKTMVPRAEQNKVLEPRLAAVRPVPNVVGVQEAPVLAAGKAASAVAALQRTPD